MNTTIKKQVCSIEQAKQLANLGLLQNSLFYYVNNWKDPRGNEIDDGEHIIISCESHLTRLKGRIRNTEVEFVSAYTETELCAFYQLCHVKGIYGNSVIAKADFLIETLKGQSLFSIIDCNNSYVKYFEINLDNEEL